MTNFYYRNIIQFLPLQMKHFSLLHKWLNTPHVHRWWGENLVWSYDSIQKKYDSYTRRYKVIDDQPPKPIYPFIIQVDRPIGYIQYYNVRDFPMENKVSSEELPELTAALDFYIGEEDYTSKGYSKQIIEKFLHAEVWKRFNACLVDPAKGNTASIKLFNNLTFKQVHLQQNANDGFVFMLKVREHMEGSSPHGCKR